MARATDESVENATCPYCQRPLRDNASEDGRHGRSSSPGIQGGFVRPEYFQMLRQQRLSDSSDFSHPPSPQRRLVQPDHDREDLPVAPSSETDLFENGPFSSNTQGISSSALSPGYFQKFFVEEGELGKGGRGVVLLVRHVLDGVSLGYFACKRVPVGDDHEWLAKVLLEVQTLQHLVHQNLVSYRHVWLEDFKRNNFSPTVPCAFILQQYCNGGDLQNYVCGPAVKTTSGGFKERLRRRSKADLEPPRGINEPRRLHLEDIYSFFKDITSGLRYLHNNGFIHRDLKPSNCLIHKTGHELRVLISDFGEVQSENAVRKSSGATGTISYCAPEVLQQVSPGGPYGNFTFKSDVFSLGMILYFLCFATLPYHGADVLHEELEDLDSLRAEISQWSGFREEHKIRPELPDRLYSFLKRLLAVNPKQRPTTDEVLQGIRTGGDLGESRWYGRSTPTNPDEFNSKHRIVPIDSPGPASPSPSRVSSQSTAIARHRPSRLRHLSLEPESSGSESPSNALTQDSQGSRSPDRDLILRPKLPSPHQSREDINRSRLSPKIVQSPYLLPSNAGASTLGTRRFSSNLSAGRLFRLLVALSKVLSIHKLCKTGNFNPYIFYPLLALAIWDYGAHYKGILWSVIATLVHLVVLFLGLHSGKLCNTKSWNDSNAHDNIMEWEY